jgi:hypothetical protein
MNKGQRVRVVRDSTHTHPNDPDLVGLEGTITGRGTDLLVEVRLPFPGTGKPFGFLMDPSELEPLP